MHRVPPSVHDRDNVAHFDEWARSYDTGRIAGWFKYTQCLVIDAMRLEKDSKILDVGCGTGTAVLMVANHVPDGKACGIDISQEMIRQANLRIPVSMMDRIEFRKAGSDCIPYPEGYFDGVLCTNSFHHYVDPIAALKEMKRVLRPTGEALILENAPDLSWYTWMWDRILRIMEPGHVRYYPSHELGDIMRRAGFEDVRLRYLKNECFKHGKLFASLQMWSGRKPNDEGEHKEAINDYPGNCRTRQQRCSSDH